MWGLLSTSAVEGEGGCQGCAFQDFEAVLLSLQAGHTVGSPATCGPWGWCSSPCSTASSPSTTAYLRSSSAKSRLPSTPSLSEYSLPFLPGHGGLDWASWSWRGSPQHPKGHSCADNRLLCSRHQEAGAGLGQLVGRWGRLRAVVAPVAPPAFPSCHHCAHPGLTTCCVSQGWPGLRKHCVLDPETAGPGPTAAADSF